SLRDSSASPRRGCRSTTMMTQRGLAAVRLDVTSCTPEEVVVVEPPDGSANKLRACQIGAVVQVPHPATSPQTTRPVWLAVARQRTSFGCREGLVHQPLRV